MDPYTALIEGESRRVLGFDEAGKILSLDNGRRYAFERLNYKPKGRSEEPEGDIFGCRLLEAARLRPWRNDWKLNNEAEPLFAWLDAQLNIPLAALNAQSKVQNKVPDFKLVVLRMRLREIPNDIQAHVNGVAWFEHDDGAGGWDTPILLKVFRPVAGSGNAVPPENAELSDLKTKLKDAETAKLKAQAVAALTLKEALSKWMRFDPPGMAAETKARIEKAVKLYLTDDAMRSERKIARAFSVSHKTVSGWFRTFSEETGFPVVMHQRHEGVQIHLAADLEQPEDREHEEE